MKTMQTGIAAAIGLSTLALVVGCGSNGHAANRTATTGPTAARTSTASYVAAVDTLQRTVQNASSAFFHSPTSAGARLERTRALRSAYTSAVRRLAGMHPPKIALSAQRGLMTEWRSVGDQLARVLAKNPFSYARANDVALAAEQPNASAYNAILTLP